MAERQHKISIVVGGFEISPWEDYSIESSLVEPSDSFTVRRAWDPVAWNICGRDSRVKVLINDVVMLDGFIDDRRAMRRDGLFEISGRDKAGRLVQESAPSFSFSGLSMTEVVRRLASPWFAKVSLTDARNRRVRRGKGRKAAAASEPVTIDAKKTGGRIDPGQMRWQVIEEIVSKAGYLCWSAADGSELIIGKPNHGQEAQILCAHPATGSSMKSTVIDLEHVESNGDRYSLIVVRGSGGGTDADYGVGVSSRGAVEADGPNPDGTGRDFLYPKRLVLPERHLKNNAEARAIAEREAKRRDFKRVEVVATMPLHGQVVGGTTPTLYAPNTIARVVDDEFSDPLDALYLVYACSYEGSREGGERTTLRMVPRGTEIVL